jgi:hypothetical protein
MNQGRFHLLCLNMNCKLTIIVLLIGFLYNSCKKESEPLYSNGTVTGTVKMHDDTDAANTIIIAHGPYGSSSTLSDADGKYKLPGLGNGTYKIEFSKNGYGSKFRQGVQVFGYDTVYLDIELYKKADYKMPKLSSVLYYPSFSDMDEYSVAIVTDIPWDNNEIMQIRVFVSDTENVSNKNYRHSDQAYVYERENHTRVMVVCANPGIVNSANDYLYEKGQTLYLIAYVCSIYEEIGEFDEYYGVPIFSTVDEQKHSQVIEIIAP